jgi:hypothetical protein
VRRLGELLFLKPGELGRAWPFFACYLLLFCAFSVADGLSQALFVKRVGVGSLPLYYAVTAAANLVLIGGYVLVAERAGGLRMFQLILGVTAAVYAASWLALRWLGGGPGWYGALFVAREIGFTLVLMHFGTYLQDYFTRDQLSRVLPVVYAGGRVGGIAGGAVLEWLSGPLGLLNVLPVFFGLCLLCMAVLLVISRRFRAVHAPEDGQADRDVVGPGTAAEQEAGRSLGGFVRYVWASPLLFWTSVSSVLFMVVRWVLNYQYNRFFAEEFGDALSLTQFLGRYTQLAMLLSLLIQLFLVNRLVAWVGLGGAYAGYAALVCGGALLCVPPMTLGVAVFARLLETELRFGVRNPLMQLLTNKFSKGLRLRVRAWTMGLLTPLGTFTSSALLGGLVRAGVGGWIPWVGGGLGLVYLLSALGLYRSFRAVPPGREGGAGEPTVPRPEAAASPQT